MLLEARGIVVGYGNTRVLKGISIDLAEGQALAVLGANGAGKSTLMATLAGLLRPWEGRIVLDGQDITDVPAEERPALGVALAPEGRGIFATLSIEENLLMGATSLKRRFGAADAKRRTAETLDRVYTMFPVLGARRKDRGSNLSGGQQQMLAIGRALLAQPKVLLMDEPCLGLAPKVGNEVYAALQELRRDGQSLVVVEESSRRALQFADRACVIKVGEKVLEDGGGIACGRTTACSRRTSASTPRRRSREHVHPARRRRAERRLDLRAARARADARLQRHEPHQLRLRDDAGLVGVRRARDARPGGAVRADGPALHRSSPRSSRW